MSRFLRERYRGFDAYVPGEQPQDRAYIKLNTNESPYPPAPEVIAAVDESQVADLRLYNDPEANRLKEAIARRYGVKKENVFVSNGSDDILNFAFMAFSGPEAPAAFPDVSYGFYKVYARFQQVDYVQIPLTADFRIDPKDYCGLDRFIVIANPNAPTGIALTPEEIEPILQTNPNNVVLVDEAYVDFGGESCLKLLDKYPNLLVVMTCSKSRSLAGARLGFAFGSAEIIGDLKLIQYSTNPYSVNRLTQAAGTAAMEAADYYREKCDAVIAAREYTAEKLKELGFELFPSKANFLFAGKRGISGEQLYTALKQRGILVRHFTGQRTAPYVRITVGTFEQMDALLDAIRDILKEV